MSDLRFLVLVAVLFLHASFTSKSEATENISGVVGLSLLAISVAWWLVRMYLNER